MKTKMPKPVAWQNRHKPIEILSDDDLDPVWRDMYRPLYAFGPLCNSCNDVGVFTTVNEGPYDCYDCGRKAPQPAEPETIPETVASDNSEPVKGPSDKDLIDLWQPFSGFPENWIADFARAVLARYGARP